MYSEKIKHFSDKVVGRKRGFACVWALLFACYCSAVPADHATIKDARTLLVDGVYRVGARVKFDMDEKVQQALDNGVPLVVDIQIVVVRERNWLWSAQVSEFKQRYSIQYHALSQRYLVRNFSSSEQQSFRHIDDALEAIGNVYDIPVIDADRLQPDSQYQVRMRAMFDVESLPTPIRLWAYFGSDWKLTGGWHQWPLQP